MPIATLTHDAGRDYLLFFCEGCDTHHHVTVNVPGSWQWNGNLEAPTITPSILVNRDAVAGVPVCHSFVRDGQIQYLSDCTHHLAGRTVPLATLP